MTHLASCLTLTGRPWLLPTERASVSAISLRNILASPGYAPGTITVNVTWMNRGFNAYQTHRSMYPSIFNRFPVIEPVSSKVCHFSTFWTPMGTPLGQSQERACLLSDELSKKDTWKCSAVQLEVHLYEALPALVMSVLCS